MSELNYYIEEIDRLNLFENLSSNAKQLQSSGMALLSIAKLPTRKDESWKYTRLDDALAKNYTWEKIDPQISYSKLSEANPSFYHIYISEHGVTHNIQDPGFKLTHINNCEDFENIYSTKNFNDDISIILNQSYLTNGYCFEFSKKYQNERPIIIHYNFIHPLSNISLVNQIICEDNTDVDLLEDFNSSEEIFGNIYTRIKLGQNSRINHVNIQDAKNGSLVLQNLNASVAKDSTYRNNNIQIGAKLSRSNIEISLEGELAHCDVHGLYSLHNDQHHDTSSYIHHEVSHTTSDQLYKGILADESRGVFTGKVRVEKDAQLINAGQLNKNLLLSKKAQVNSRPQLEIYADDVKCSHGSTTGQIGRDELFYLQARGIPRERAQAILARAFTYDVVLKQPNLAMRDYIVEHLTKKNVVQQL